MRNRFQRINCVLNLLGHLLQILALVILVPVPLCAVFAGRYGDGPDTMLAFATPAAISFSAGLLLRRFFRQSRLDVASSMILCVFAWVFSSIIGAIPFFLTGVAPDFFSAFFEAVSGFTTTGITMLSGLDSMPRSILLWRALTQWCGGLGILSFFLAVTFRAAGAHHIFGAESHKTSSNRLAPGLFSTLKILWSIYIAFTIVSALLLYVAGMNVFDTLCHSLTSISTAGFSPHDANIAYYSTSGHTHYKRIEYALIVIMLFGSINFLVFYRLVCGEFRALWDNLEIKWWWLLLPAFCALTLLDRFQLYRMIEALLTDPASIDIPAAEESFRETLFHTVSLFTTTGFTTTDIADPRFGALSKQVFLVMMIIGGCAGSTSGGFKILRTAVLAKLTARELFHLRVSERAFSSLIVDGKVIPAEEIRRISSLFFCWMALLVVGGGVTALLSAHGPVESFSGMCSALGNIGPCYITPGEMIELNPAVKTVYIIGMLAGRLEILPVLLLVCPKAWR